MLAGDPLQHALVDAPACGFDDRAVDALAAAPEEVVDEAERQSRVEVLPVPLRHHVAVVVGREGLQRDVRRLPPGLEDEPAEEPVGHRLAVLSAGPTPDDSRENRLALDQRTITRMWRRV